MEDQKIVVNNDFNNKLKGYFVRLSRVNLVQWLNMFVGGQ